MRYIDQGGRVLIFKVRYTIIDGVWTGDYNEYLFCAEMLSNSSSINFYTECLQQHEVFKVLTTSKFEFRNPTYHKKWGERRTCQLY